MGGASVKIFDYCSLADDLCVRYAGQLPQAEQQLRILRDSGRLSLGGSNRTLLDPNVKEMLLGARLETVTALKSLLEQLEYLDTLIVASECRPTIVTATLDDVITTLAQSGIEMKPSHWAVVCMLCDECGKPLTPQQLVNALKHNKITSTKPLASRQAIIEAYIPYTKKEHFPNWPRNTKKQLLYYEIATLIKPLIDVMA